MIPTRKLCESFQLWFDFLLIKNFIKNQKYIHTFFYRFEIMKKCWKWRSSSRPSFSALVTMIDNAIQSLGEVDYVNLVEMVMDDVDKEVSFFYVFFEDKIFCVRNDKTHVISCLWVSSRFSNSFCLLLSNCDCLSNALSDLRSQLETHLRS